MGKKEDNKRLLLNSFRQKATLSTGEIMELLHTSSKGSVNTYLNYLRNDGFIIEEELLPRGKKNYSLKTNDDEAVYEEISKKDWQNFIILSSLNDALTYNSSVFRNKLIDYILEEKELSIGLKGSAIFNRLNEMCDEGMIREKNDKHPADLSPGPEISVVEGFNYEEADLLLRNLSSIPDADPFHDTLQEIKNDVEQLSDVIISVEEAPSFLSQGKKYKELQLNKELSSIFGSCDYKSYVCDITYRSKSAEHTSIIRLGIGLIVYVLEKDKIYVIGKEYTDGLQSENRILITDHIEHVSETIIEGRHVNNPCWEAPEFLNIYEEMLSISVEPCETVVLRFDDKDFIESKLDTLKKTRKKAKIEKRDGYILYTDEVRGLSDLRNYLRIFTERCAVLSPETLKADMIRGIRQNLLLYGENDEITD